jgi:hypothetical protein
MLHRLLTRLSISLESWQASTPVAIASLILVNLAQLLGVLYWDWTLYSVVLLFWLENAVIGFYNVLKIMTAQGPEEHPPQAFGVSMDSDSTLHRFYRLLRRLGITAGFCVHFGMFWFVHGVFVQAFFSPAPFSFLTVDARLDVPAGLLGTLGMMFLSHGSSFITNYLGHDEFRQITPRQQMTAPYGRIFVLHFVVLAGGALVLRLEEPLYGVILLVILKIMVDLYAHLREHGRLPALRPARRAR